MSFQDTAGGREDVDHGAGAAKFPAGGGHDVAIGVQAHSVDAPVDGVGVPSEAVQGPVGAQAAVVVDGVGTQFPVNVHAVAVALDHVQGALVGGHQDAVGHGGVEGDASYGVAAVGLGVGPQHRTVVQFFDLAGVDVAGVPGVGEPDAATAVDGQVVGSVKFLAVDPVGYRHDGIVVKADDGAAPGTAAEEMAPAIEGQAVGVVGAGTGLGDGAGVGVVAQDAAGWDVGKEDGLTVPHRPLTDAAIGSNKQLELILPRHWVVPPGFADWIGQIIHE